METQDTILRIIQQTALILRAFFNPLPQDPLEEKDLTDLHPSSKDNQHLIWKYYCS